MTTKRRPSVAPGSAAVTLGVTGARHQAPAWPFLRPGRLRPLRAQGFKYTGVIPEGVGYGHPVVLAETFVDPSRVVRSDRRANKRDVYSTEITTTIAKLDRFHAPARIRTRTQPAGACLG